MRSMPRRATSATPPRPGCAPPTGSPGAHHDLLVGGQSARVSAPSRRDHDPVPSRYREAGTGPAGTTSARPRWLSVLQEVDVDEEGARWRRRRPSCRGRGRPESQSAPGRGRRSTRTSRKVATPIRKPPVAAATAAGSETSDAALDRPRFGEHGQRTDLGLVLEVRKVGGSTRRRMNHVCLIKGLRSYTRYFFTISPPIASMPGSSPCWSPGSSPSRRP